MKTACYAIALAAALCAMPAHSVQCDLTKLNPILNSPDMLQCRSDAGVYIPTATAEKKGIDPRTFALTNSVVCKLPACGRAITAIKALGWQECEVAVEVCVRGGCATMNVNLFSDHIAVLDAYCGGKYVTDGASPPVPATTRPGPPVDEPTATTAPPVTSPPESNASGGSAQDDTDAPSGSGSSSASEVGPVVPAPSPSAGSRVSTAIAAVGIASAVGVWVAN